MDQRRERIELERLLQQMRRTRYSFSSKFAGMPVPVSATVITAYSHRRFRGGINSGLRADGLQIPLRVALSYIESELAKAARDVAVERK